MPRSFGRQLNAAGSRYRLAIRSLLQTSVLTLFATVGASVVNAQPITIVSGPSVSAVSADAAVISWTTDAESQGSVTYWADGGEPQVSHDLAGLTTNHQVTLVGLQPNTVYSYQATSTDLWGETAVSDVDTFATTDYSPIDDIDLLWANQVQTNTDQQFGFASFSDGSSVIAANMFGTRTYGSGSSAVTLTSAGGRDVALVRFNALGEFQWVRRAGGAGEETATRVIALPDGSMVVAGYFNGASTFGPGEPNQTTLVSDGYDAFAAKFGPGGTLIWVRRIEVVGSSGIAIPRGITALPDGSVVVALVTTASVAIDSYSVSAVGIVTMRLDSSGSVLWLKGAGGPAKDTPTAASTTADGFVMVGYIQGTAVFGAGEVNQTTLSTAPEGFAGFAARYLADGSLVWAKPVDLSLVHSVVTMPDGSLALAGNRLYSLNGFVSRWSSTGSALWTRVINTSSYGVPALAVMPDGSLVAAGSYFGGVAVVDNGSGGDVTLPPNLDSYFADMFVVRYTADGILARAFADGITAGGEMPFGIGVASAISVVIAGQIGGPTALGRGRSNEQHFEGVAGADTFLARYTFISNVTPTPIGSGIAVEPVTTAPDGSSRSVSVEFDSVATAGTTTLTVAASGPPPPDGFKLGQPPIYYDVTTTATFNGSIQVCFQWSEGELSDENDARLFHHESGDWVDITTSVDTVANRICGRTNSLSPFVIAQQRIFGFYQPVDNAPVVNQVKAGSAIPVKFSLGGNEGNDIFAAGYPKSQLITCDTSAPINAVEETVTAGGSTLSFDAATSVYSYIWKTEKVWANSCRIFSLKLADGTTKIAKFRLTK